MLFPGELKLLSYIRLFVTPWTIRPWNSPGQNTGVSSCSLLQGIFPTQGSTPGLLHCRQILCQLSHQGSPRILVWVTYPFSRGSSQPRNRTGSLALQADSSPAVFPLGFLKVSGKQATRAPSTGLLRLAEVSFY